MVTCCLRALARNPQKAVKKLRNRLLYAAALLLREVVRWGPHLGVGERQGGLVALLLAQPLVLEWACRFRATMPMELGPPRQTLQFVQGLISVDPAITRGFPKFDTLKVSLPEMFSSQLRAIPRFVIALERP